MSNNSSFQSSHPSTSQPSTSNDDALLLRIPTNRTQKRRNIRLNFNDEDKFAIDAQRREEERLKRLQNQHLTTSDHIYQMQRLYDNQFSQNGYEWPNYQSYPQNVQYTQNSFSNSFYDENTGNYNQKNYVPIEMPASHVGPQTVAANNSLAPEVIELSSDSEVEELPSSQNSMESLFSGKRARWANMGRSRSDIREMTKQTDFEKKRLKKMRTTEELENTDVYEGRLLVNSGHPEEDPDIFVLPHLTHILQPHQLGGIRFMYDNTIESLKVYRETPGLGCILAHSMGLGKTLQVITFVEIFLRATKSKHVLIIVPVNTIQNWLSEFEKFMPKYSPAGEFIRDFEIFLFGDAIKSFEQRVNFIEEWHTRGGVLIMGYDMFRLMLKSTMPKKSKRMTLNLNGVSSGNPLPMRMNDFKGSEEFLEDGRKKSHASELIRSALISPGPQLVICDEGHKIKNLNSDISMALGSMKTTRRIVLTGYPLQNNLMEYYCMIDFVRPMFLGSRKTFVEQFEKPIKNGQCIDSTSADVKMARQRTHVLSEKVKGFVQRRTHHLLKQVLPESREYVILLRKSNIQRLLYRAFVLYAKEEIAIGYMSTFNPLKAFAACSKIWNHPDILWKTMQNKREDNMMNEQQNALENGTLPPNWDPLTPVPIRRTKRTVKPRTKTILNMNGVLEEVETSIRYDWADEIMKDYTVGLLENGYKMIVAMSILDECTKRGEKLLIFSQNLSVLDLLEEILSKRVVVKEGVSNAIWAKNRNYFRFDGSTSGIDREKLINKFNSDPNVFLFLISTKAGSLGINLVSASRCIIMDACWNPCHDAQAVCRIYRYGQKKKTFIYRLITDNSMERAVFNRQVSKHGLQQRVVDDAQVDANITQKELETLLVYDESLDVMSREWDITDWDFEDDLLTQVAKSYNRLFAEKPFLHESLMLESEKTLSEFEKKEAQLLYDRERRIAEQYESPVLDSSVARSKIRPPQYPQYSSMNRFLPFVPGNSESNIPGPVPMHSTPIPQQLSRRNNGNRFPTVETVVPITSSHPMFGKLLVDVNRKDPVVFSADGRTGFPGAIAYSQREDNANGFSQQIVTDRDMMLPIVGNNRLFPLPANSNVFLVRSGRDVYLKTNEFFLNAANTIYHSYVNSLEQSQIAPPVVTLE